MLIRLLATVGFLGYARLAPGTVASLVTTVFAWWLASYVAPSMFLVITICICIAGVIVSELYVRHHSQNLDPGEVVIDEVAGQLVCFATLAYLSVLAANSADVLTYLNAQATGSLYFWMAGFILFRVFDIIKPWPVSWADARVKGGLGVMLDDIIAGVLAGFVLFMAMNLFPAIFIPGAELP